MPHEAAMGANPALMDYAYGFAWLGVCLAVLGALLFLLRHRRGDHPQRRSTDPSPVATMEPLDRSRRALVDKAPRNGIERIQADVRRFGWHGVRVKGQDQGGGYLFTVGLWRTYHHPEIVLFAPEEDPSGMLKPLQRVCQAISQNEVFEAEQAHPKLFDDFPGVFGLVDPSWYEQYLAAATAFYGDSGFPALQLFWPDRHGLFPWEDGCSARVRGWQPLLYEEAPSQVGHFEPWSSEGRGEDSEHSEAVPHAPASRPASEDDLQLRASDLFANLSEVDPGRLMKDWLWLTGEDLRPLQVTIFGDVFLTAPDDGPIYFLDTGRGELEEVAPDRRTWKSLLADPPAQWFHNAVLMDLLKADKRPGVGKVFSWRTPLSAGGEEEAHNISVADARLHLGQTSRAAQAAHQE